MNALNAKYLIVGADNAPLENENVLGNVWFVEDCVFAKTPDEALGATGREDLSRVAVLEGTPEEVPVGEGAERDVIALTSYAPNALTYHYEAADNRLAVFSEIFYPGWTARLEDGADLPLRRADWTLRAAVLPAGSHDITFRFEPASYRTGARISRICSIALLLLLLAACGGFCLPEKRP